MSSTVAILNLSSKYIPLAIVTAVSAIIAGSLLHYTRRIWKMPTYFRANFSICKGTFNLNIAIPKTAIIAAILYYALLATPVTLLIIWLVLLGNDTGVVPALPILFTSLFLITLVIPSSSNLFYLKVMIGFILFIVAQLATLTLSWDPTYNQLLLRSSSAFFCLTAVLLSVNGIFVASSLWFIDGTCWNLPNGIPKILKDKIR